MLRSRRTHRAELRLDSAHVRLDLAPPEARPAPWRCRRGLLLLDGRYPDPLDLPTRNSKTERQGGETSREENKPSHATGSYRQDDTEQGRSSIIGEIAQHAAKAALEGPRSRG